MVTERLTVKVNYILDARNNGKFNTDTFIHKHFDNRTKNTKVIGKYVNTNIPRNNGKFNLLSSNLKRNTKIWGNVDNYKSS